ncbi:hypothetical protein C8R47DRAFT_1229979 [Mycena vitilis]|nr:hypothetical protein C8R47DRAFT_1229979 [Mycena vitilis]
MHAANVASAALDRVARRIPPRSRLQFALPAFVGHRFFLHVPRRISATSTFKCSALLQSCVPMALRALMLELELLCSLTSPLSFISYYFLLNIARHTLVKYPPS